MANGDGLDLGQLAKGFGTGVVTSVGAQNLMKAIKGKAKVDAVDDAVDELHPGQQKVIGKVKDVVADDDVLAKSLDKRTKRALVAQNKAADKLATKAIERAKIKTAAPIAVADEAVRDVVENNIDLDLGDFKIDISPTPELSYVHPSTQRLQELNVFRLQQRIRNFRFVYPPTSSFYEVPQAYAY